MLKDFIQLIYPPCCLCCKASLEPHESLVCTLCKTEFPRTYFENTPNNLVEQVFKGRIPLKQATSLWYFYSESRTQELMHALKYNDFKEVGNYMGELLGKSIIESNRFEKVNTIIPVPLHRKKLERRGYNQAELIANGLANILQVEVDTHSLKRVQFNQSQTKKGRFDRWKNVETIFKLTDIQTITNKKVLLIDDVVTTGATLEACGKELVKGKVESLSIATVAYTA